MRNLARVNRTENLYGDLKLDIFDSVALRNALKGAEHIRNIICFTNAFDYSCLKYSYSKAHIYDITIFVHKGAQGYEHKFAVGGDSHRRGELELHCYLTGGSPGILDRIHTQT